MSNKTKKSKPASKFGKKGQYQYISQEKKRRLIRTILCFLPSVLFLVTGWIWFGTRDNLMTVAAVLLCLPAGKQLVGLIMIMMFKSMPSDLYHKIEEHKGSLTMVYECILTNYEKNTIVEAFAICGNQVVGYTSSDKADVKYVEQNTQKILKNNGYGVTVKLIKDEKQFLNRLDGLNANSSSLREDIPFTPDDRYPELSREELIKHTILAISL